MNGYRLEKLLKLHWSLLFALAGSLLGKSP